VIEDAILDESTQTVLGKPILHTETEKWNIKLILAENQRTA